MSKKLLFILIVIVFSYMVISMFYGESKINNYIMRTYEFPNNAINSVKIDRSDDIKIIDINQAVDYASEVLISVYGESVTSTFPLKGQYDEKYDLWVLSGELDNNMVGGIPYICIEASSGEIIYLSHSK